METINKASINACSPYNILSKETLKVKETCISTNVRYVHWGHSFRENTVEIDLEKHRVTANYKTSISAE